MKNIIFCDKYKFKSILDAEHLISNDIVIVKENYISFFIDFKTLKYDIKGNIKEANFLSPNLQDFLSDGEINLSKYNKKLHNKKNDINDWMKEMINSTFENIFLVAQYNFDESFSHHLFVKMNKSQKIKENFNLIFINSEIGED